MKSNMCTWTSALPLRSVCLKWPLMSVCCLGSLDMMVLKWAWIRSIHLNLVCPAYLERDFGYLEKWFAANKLSLNKDKTKAMLFTGKKVSISKLQSQCKRWWYIDRTGRLFWISWCPYWSTSDFWTSYKRNSEKSKPAYKSNVKN